MMRITREYNTMNAGFKLKAGLITLREGKRMIEDYLLRQGLLTMSMTRLELVNVKRKEDNDNELYNVWEFVCRQL
jgi:hypothetical protein